MFFFVGNTVCVFLVTSFAIAVLLKNVIPADNEGLLYLQNCRNRLQRDVVHFK